MPRTTLVSVNSDAEVPAFTNENDEAEFWSTHELGPGLLAQMRPIAPDGEGMLPPAREERTKPVPIRFDADTLKRLRALAVKKGTGYQTLLKTFVTERLYEEEKREGLIPEATPRHTAATARKSGRAVRTGASIPAKALRRRPSTTSS